MLHLNHYEVKKMHNWYLHKKVIDNLFDRINTLEYQTLLKGCIFSYLINYDNPYDILLKYLKPSLNNHDKSLVYGLFSGAIIDSINTNVRCINLSFDQKMIESENEFIEELNKEIISSEIRNYDGKTVDGDVGEISEYVYMCLNPWLTKHDYSTLLIDLDNTIFDFDLGEYISFVNVIKKHNLEYNDTFFETYKRINKMLWKEIEDGLITKDEMSRQRFTLTFRELHMNEDIGPLCGEEYKEELSHRNDYIEGARKAMKELHEHYHIAIITNGVKTTQISRISSTDLNNYFEELFISEEIGFEKPSVNYFEYVLDHIEEKDKTKILVIGDSISSDIKGAYNANLDAVWISKEIKKAEYPIIATLPSIKYLYLFLNH